MLNVWFGHDAPFEYFKFTTGIASRNLSPDVFKKQFVRDMIKDIDNVDTDEDGRMWHPTFGAVNQSKLSNGLCALLLALEMDLCLDMTYMGDNCVPWLVKIAENKDVTCVCNRVPVVLVDFTFYDMRRKKYFHTGERFAAMALLTVLDERQARIDAKNRDKGCCDE